VILSHSLANSRLVGQPFKSCADRGWWPIFSSKVDRKIETDAFESGFKEIARSGCLEVRTTTIATECDKVNVTGLLISLETPRHELRIRMVVAFREPKMCIYSQSGTAPPSRKEREKGRAREVIVFVQRRLISS
jgi:hypothetical protein